MSGAELVHDPWTIGEPGRHRGDRYLTRREDAPMGRLLPYRRWAGESPPESGHAPPGGWCVNLDQPELGMGDALFALGLVRGLAEATGCLDSGLIYHGPRTSLMRRCALPLEVIHRQGQQTVRTPAPPAETFDAKPGQATTLWLDLRDDDLVEVHSALPMRYYLDVEIATGVRLPAARDPLPAFRSPEAAARPAHVVFVSSSSEPHTKSYGLAGFRRVAESLAERGPEKLELTLITAPGAEPGAAPFGDLPVQVLTGLDAVDCVDVFATAELVIGNDTGLTHLAALTTRPDGSGPQVLTLYFTFAAAKYTTGSPRQHAVSTRFSQMLSVADRGTQRDRRDPGLWGSSSAASSIPARSVADFAGELAGWWSPGSDARGETV